MQLIESEWCELLQRPIRCKDDVESRVRKGQDVRERRRKEQMREHTSSFLNII